MKKIQLLLLSFCLPVFLQAQVITTYAGTGVWGYGGDGGPATAAQVNQPFFMTTDGSGNLYIADYYSHRIRKVNPAGIITTIAGTGTSGFSGDGGPATAAQFSYPRGIVLDGIGNVYISDQNNNRIRKIDTSGIINTIAGNGSWGYSGDGGPATAAEFSYACGMAIDISGNLYIVDYSLIRKVNPSGIISTVAGTSTFGYGGDGGPATAAQFNNPAGLAVDRSGNLYIADDGNGRVRMVSPSGTINTIAGTDTSGYSGDGGPATAARLSYPTDVGIDSLNNLFIADDLNNRIRKISASGIITTVVGTGATGFSGDGGPATAAQLDEPIGLCAGGASDLYIIDGHNKRIRRVSCMNPPYVSVLSGLDTLCAGSIVTLTDSVAGGTWSVINSSASVSGGTVTGISSGIDTVFYTVSNACGSSSSSIEIFINACGTLDAGRSIVADDQVVLYPNPTTNEIHLQSGYILYTISLYDLTGRQIYTKACDDHHVDIGLGQLPKGIYFIKVNNTKTYMIIKE